jgi:AcrR family transcriptional regulator
MPAAGTRTKSDERRHTVMAAAVERFAQKGFYGTTTHEIAESAGISQPYLYRLYPNKEALFAAAVGYVSDIMAEALTAHSPAPDAGEMTPERALAAARDAYGALVADRTILRFLMHANCAASEPLVRDAVRRCYAKQIDIVRQLLHGDDEAVRRWLGAGMVDNVAFTLDLPNVDEPWARVLSVR